uniref:Uncharacterized protein n=1 Tax=Planktothricoides sp. SpSt-374 TaxID=2282167 RepID=A0A7C3VP28_9CYAN
MSFVKGLGRNGLLPHPPTPLSQKGRGGLTPLSPSGRGVGGEGKIGRQKLPKLRKADGGRLIERHFPKLP